MESLSQGNKNTINKTYLENSFNDISNIFHRSGPRATDTYLERENATFHDDVCTTDK